MLLGASMPACSKIILGWMNSELRNSQPAAMYIEDVFYLEQIIVHAADTLDGFELKVDHHCKLPRSASEHSEYTL